MDKLLANAKCKLASQAFGTYYNNIYGLACDANNVEWLDLLLWAYDSNCISKDIDCNHCAGSDCIHCTLQSNIGKAVKYCKDCKPKKYMEPKVTPNPDYTEWYNSDEYIECLQIQLEESGYIEPMIDLCTNLNINITQEDACKMIVSHIAAQQVDCFMLTDLHIQQACSTIITELNVENLCATIDSEIYVENLCVTIPTNIDAEEGEL